MQSDPAGDVTGSLTLTDTKTAVTRFRPAQRRHVICPGGPGPPFPQSDSLPSCQKQRNPKGRVPSADKMVLLTMIARLADGLPLAASMQEDEQVGHNAALRSNWVQSRLCVATVRKTPLRLCPVHVAAPLFLRVQVGHRLKVLQLQASTVDKWLVYLHRVTAT